MFNHKRTCQACKTCCKFEKEDIYFAPIFSKNEIDLLISKGVKKELFKTHKNSKNVLQIKLIKSKENSKIYNCPFLKVKQGLCKIYENRPLDCKIWPLMVMKDKDSPKNFLVYFDYSCKITEQMTKEENEEFLKKLVQWFDESNFIETFKKNPDLIWNFETQAIPIKEI
ncbi:hypothetical protein A2229_05145 [Candidatus Peregrinibacteria bacterium RIFOXYA2_FULL_33_7]|nr:MAG: hypothetical protein A2229_05145 [Candidatus Peregrinibacteria bacterium RIFOXYA2_FULL_33_7]